MDGSKELVEFDTNSSEAEKYYEMLIENISLYQESKEKQYRENILSGYYLPNQSVFQNNYNRNKEILKIMEQYQSFYGRIPDYEEIAGYPVWWEGNQGVIFFMDGKFTRIIPYNRKEDDHGENFCYLNVINLRTLYHLKGNLCYLLYEEQIFHILLLTADFEKLLQNKRCIIMAGISSISDYMGNLSLEKKSVPFHLRGLIWEQEKEIGEEIQSIFNLCTLQEKKLTYGRLYPDKTFYVIRSRPITSSIAAQLMIVLESLRKAEEYNAIPVIDFTKGDSPHLTCEEINIVDYWEYYFEQPTQYKLNTVYHSKNVILGDVSNETEVFTVDHIADNIEIKNYAQRLFDQYIYLSGRVLKKIDQEYQKIFKEGMKVLGVTYRGTDYRNRKFSGLYIQPEINELMERVERLMDQWGCSHLFLGTEDKDAVSTFRARFGERLLVTEKERYGSQVKFTFSHNFDRDNDPYLKGEEYLTELVLISRCQCFIGSRLGALLMILLLNHDRFEEKYIYDLGIY